MHRLVKFQLVLDLVEIVELFLHVLIQFHKGAALITVLLGIDVVALVGLGRAEPPNEDHLILDVLVLVALGGGVLVPQDRVEVRYLLLVLLW